MTPRKPGPLITDRVRTDDVQRIAESGSRDWVVRDIARDLLAARARITALEAERDALLAEVKAWRGYDRAINQKDRMALLSDALRLREQNEGGERG
jgi:hypothetical protein